MTSEEPGAYEEQHVHSVYEEIAPHFSSTRYKPWPIIESYLKDLQSGSIGLDVGCGNGKYLAVNKDIYIVGSDSWRVFLVLQPAPIHSTGSDAYPHSAIVADILALPHQPSVFDFAISIAVIHHLSTSTRRVEAVASVLECLKPTGTALLYVWALEQASSRRGWSESDDQDVMVPWVMRKKGEGERTFQRYYHLYRKGELEADVVRARGEVVESGYEKDNWWVIAKRGSPS
ncbi:tRNA methyltransferase, has a role in tRNA modification [Oleoguttula sp. CCFEE 5521]